MIGAGTATAMSPLAMKDIYESSDKTLIDLLLDEQRSIDTPIGKVSEDAKRSERFGSGPVFDSLIPLSVPEPGYQYGFQVDLDRCSVAKVA